MEVSFYATFRPIVGGKTANIPVPAGATVRDLLVIATDTWPALGEYVWEEGGGLSRRVAVYVDGRNIRWLPDRDATVLYSENRVAIFPPVAGG
jgi:MoaD family protein